MNNKFYTPIGLVILLQPIPIIFTLSYIDGF